MNQLDEIINGLIYKTEDPNRYELRLSGYKWYQQQAPYDNSLWISTWKLAAIFMESLDVRAWVEPVDGIRWKWKVKQLSWYDEGITENMEDAKIAVENRVMTIYDR